MWVVLLGWWLWAVPPVDGWPPLQMTSAGPFEIDLQRRHGVAKKDVVVRRSDVVVCCDEAEAFYSSARVERVVCRGRVVLRRPDGAWATADVLTFEARRDTVTLEGRAYVETKEARLRGEKMVYRLSVDRLTVTGGRSRFELDPDGKTPSSVVPPRGCPPDGQPAFLPVEAKTSVSPDAGPRP